MRRKHDVEGDVLQEYISLFWSPAVFVPWGIWRLYGSVEWEHKQEAYHDTRIISMKRSSLDDTNVHMCDLGQASE